VSALLVSSVLFETAEIVPGLDELARCCDTHRVPLLVDAYHHLNVVPFDIRALGLDRAYVTGGGYKYCQLGEGNCFLRAPRGHDLRPLVTGWFSEFATLAAARRPGELQYGEGAARLAGATYDPTSHYRAAAVFAFHERHGLTPARLRSISQHQVALLAAEFGALDLDARVASIIDVPVTRRAGFLAIRTPHAASLVAALAMRDVFADARGDVLRLGPAPYLSDQQLRDGIAALAVVLRAQSS
jgi:kynureninase